MALFDPSSRRRTGAQPRQRKAGQASGTGDSSTVLDLPPDDKPPDLGALRQSRLEYLKSPAEERGKKMRYVGETVIRAPARKADVQHVRKTSGSRRYHRRRTSESKRRQRDAPVNGSEGGEYQPVYEPRVREQGLDTQSVETLDKETDEAGCSDAEVKEPSDTNGQTKARRSKARISHSPEGRESAVRKETHTSRRRKSEPTERTRHVSGNSHGGDPSQQDFSNRNTPTKHSSRAPRPSLQRSATTIRSKSDAFLTTKSSSMRSRTAPSIAEAPAKKGSNIFSNLLRSSPSTQASLKKVACLTCGSDDIPIIKTAKLACTHRMCHDCLRRIFTMSVTDPAHMPPKCCTSEHIPLKHVDKLFDQKFKKTWNHKFQEYTTRNRIYCPGRHCGEWIKPNHMTLENGRKVGKCKRCGTRVCCICNNKMHTSRECPKDPATKVFVDVAKKEGWQRCFNCSAMVELKEGCNHMTCRCTAEFCMICGNKWKTCDCPWFNYEAVEADRLEHMNLAQGRGLFEIHDRRAPIRYQEEMDRRRHQERRDEALARRMQVLGVDDDPSDDILRRNPGNVIGLGNAADHFLNQDFRQQARDLLTGNYGHAARAAEGLVNGVFTGRENPLPPAPFGLNAPAANTANQTAQFLRHDSTPNAAPNYSARRRSHDHGDRSRRAANDVAGRPTDDPDDHPTMPLPATLPNLATRANAPQNRRASGLGGLLADGRSQDADERAAEQRIENWRSDVPLGEPADGVARV